MTADEINLTPREASVTRIQGMLDLLQQDLKVKIPVILVAAECSRNGGGPVCGHSTTAGALLYHPEGTITYKSSTIVSTTILPLILCPIASSSALFDKVLVDH